MKKPVNESDANTTADWFVAGAPILVVWILLAATSGPHLGVTTIFAIVGGIVALIGLSIAAAREVDPGTGTRADFSATLALLSFLFAFPALVLIAYKGRELHGDIANALPCLLVFCLAVQFCSGLALALRDRKPAWLLLCLVAIAQLAFAIVLVLRAAMGAWH